MFVVPYPAIDPVANRFKESPEEPSINPACRIGRVEKNFIVVFHMISSLLSLINDIPPRRDGIS